MLTSWYVIFDDCRTIYDVYDSCTKHTLDCQCVTVYACPDTHKIVAFTLNSCAFRDIRYDATVDVAVLEFDSVNTRVAHTNEYWHGCVLVDINTDNIACGVEILCASHILTALNKK